MNNRYRPIILTLAIATVACAVMPDARAFELFGVDVLTADRRLITDALQGQGGRKVGVVDDLTERYEVNRLFPGGRIYLHFTAGGRLDRVVCQFDSGNLFTEVLDFDDLKAALIAKYGRPEEPPSGERHRNWNSALRWTAEGVRIQLVRFRWFAAWTLHETHRLEFHIHPGENDAAQETRGKRPESFAADGRAAI